MCTFLYRSCFLRWLPKIQKRSNWHVDFCHCCTSSQRRMAVSKMRSSCLRFTEFINNTKTVQETFSICLEVVKKFHIAIILIVSTDRHVTEAVLQFGSHLQFVMSGWLTDNFSDLFVVQKWAERLKETNLYELITHHTLSILNYSTISKQNY